MIELILDPENWVKINNSLYWICRCTVTSPVNYEHSDACFICRDKRPELPHPAPVSPASGETAEGDTHNTAQHAEGDVFTFESASKPLMEWLAKNHHPHVRIIIDATSAELVEGVECFNSNEFIQD